MTKEIVEIYYDFADPYCYVFLDDLYEIESLKDVEVIWQPYNLKASGGIVESGTSFSEEEVSYIKEEVGRLAKERNLEIVFSPDWPKEEFDVSRATRAAFVALDLGVGKEFNYRVSYRIWGLGEDPAKDSFLIQVAEDLDLDLAEFLTKVSLVDTRERARGVVQRAKKQGVFRTPTITFKEQRFYGYWNIKRAIDVIANQR
jgi:2-hydroxychromene-2-carboxylate isomerase